MELIQKIKDQLNSEAVSPVIGVILMVAITVILAAVVGAFVFGMDNPDKAPQASLKAEAVDDPDKGEYVEITHQGGDALLASDTKVTYAGEDVEDDSNTLAKAFGDDDRFTAGESIYVGDDAGEVSNSSDDYEIVTDDNEDGDVRVIDTESEQLLLNENPRFA